MSPVRTGTGDTWALFILHAIISVPPLVPVSERQSEVHRPRTQAVQGRRFHLNDLIVVVAL